MENKIRKDWYTFVILQIRIHDTFKEYDTRKYKFI